MDIALVKCIFNFSVQGHLDNFVEAVDSTYGCVLLRGQIVTATKNWWGLHPDEIVLIMNYLLSEIPAVLKDTPVFLPVKSPTVSKYLVHGMKVYYILM